MKFMYIFIAVLLLTGCVSIIAIGGKADVHTGKIVDDASPLKYGK